MRGLLRNRLFYDAKGLSTELGYHSANVSRSSLDPRPQGGSADRHLRYDRRELANIGDQFFRDNGIYRGLVERFVSSVYGPRGFNLQPRYTSPKTNRQVERAWALHCEAPEVRGIFTWRDMERMALLSIVNNGDVGASHLKDGKVQLFESEEIGGHARMDFGPAGEGERWEGGVKLDRVGRPLAYRIHERNEHGLVRADSSLEIPAANFTFAANRDRISQTRGVPAMTPVFPMINRLNDICDSEAIAWQLLSKFTLTVNREHAAEAAYAESSPDHDGVLPGSGGVNSNGTEATRADGANRVQEFEGGVFFHAEPGESLKGIDRNLPGKDFPASVRMFLRLIGLPLGIPLEVILLDYSQTNYSSARAALEQAYRTFIRWQQFLMRNWHTPLYRAWLRWALLDRESGVTPSRELLADATGIESGRHVWLAPDYPWIDAKQEAEAWGLRMDRGLASHSQALASTGSDRSEFLEATKAEAESAIAAFVEIRTAAEKAGVEPPVTPRELMGRAQSLAATVPQALGEDADPEGESPPGGPPTEEHSHDDLKPGESCPECEGGDES